MFTQNKQNKYTYKLLDKGNNLWSFYTPEGNFDGTLDKVCKFAVLDLGFTFSEIELALSQMDKNFHDSAEFGMYMKFMYSYDRSEQLTKVSN